MADAVVLPALEPSSDDVRCRLVRNGFPAEEAHHDGIRQICGRARSILEPRNPQQEPLSLDPDLGRHSGILRGVGTISRWRA
jgi:hypothetical protein